MIDKVKHKGLALAILAAAQFMVILDATIVNVALPEIQRALGFTSAAQLQWIVTAYALLFGGFLLLGGRLADLFGRRKVFLIGVVLFALSSLLAGIAQTPAQIIIFRALQGLGGALLSPAALSLVLTIFKEGHERNKALGVWSMVAAGGGAVGLVLGGVLTEYVDWRWIFFINVPIAAAVIAAALKYVPQSAPVAKQRLDILGAVLVTASLIALVFGLVRAPENGWGSFATIGTLLTSVALMAAFVFNEMKIKYPLIDLRLFKKRNVTGGIAVPLLMSAAMFGMFFYLVFFMQELLDYTPTWTGVANLPFTIVVMIVAAVLSQKAAKINAKIVLAVAPLLVVAGLLVFAQAPLGANYWTDILPGIMLMASGMACVFVLATLVATSGVSHKESGVVSGLLNTAQQIGGAIGLAVLSVVSTSTTTKDMVAAHGDASALPAAMLHGFQHGYIAAAVFALAATVVAVVVLKSGKPSQDAIKHESESEAEALAAIPGA